MSPRTSAPLNLTVSLAAGFLLATAAVQAADDWSIKAEYIDSCCCAAPCPCIFGAAPTRDHCDTNGVVVLESAHVGDVDLSGLKIAFSLRMGTWVEYTLSEGASDAQLAAAKKLVDLTFPQFSEWPVLSFERGEITLAKEGKNIRYTSRGAVTEVELVEGDDGEPIKIANLPIPGWGDVTHYRSVTLEYEGGDRSFEYSGTTGLATTIENGGDL